MNRTQSATLAALGIGGATLVIVFAAGRRRGGAVLPYQQVDEVYPLPPLTPKTPAPASSQTIPSHPVTITQTPVAPAPMAPEVERMVHDLTRPNSTSVVPPPPDPEVERMVHELTRPASTPASSAAQRAPRQAATDLYAYVTQAMRAGDLAALGTREQPSDYIAAAQRDMRLVSSDGIYGPHTAARGKELLGREFPARNPTKRRVVVPAKVINELPPSAAQVLSLPPPEPPSLSTAVSETSPTEAANALYLLVTHPPLNWGTKKTPNPQIRAAQSDMGGLTADGVYGPKTQARGTLLTGRSFPARG